MPAQQIQLEGNLNDTSGSFDYLAVRLWSSLTPAATGAVVLDLSRVRYMGPDAAAMIVAASKLAELHGITLSALFPTEPNELVGFLQFSALKFHLATGDTVVDCAQNGKHRFRQLSKRFTGTPIGFTFPVR
ncbi:MAG TPA: hypothetical protein PKB10_05030 [Tepidisphaeraceae bacterium]|nr:hypothetical protein [Tepidisphaeraceae bacterium]